MESSDGESPRESNAIQAMEEYVDIFHKEARLQMGDAATLSAEKRTEAMLSLAEILMNMAGILIHEANPEVDGEIATIHLCIVMTTLARHGPDGLVPEEDRLPGEEDGTSEERRYDL